MLSKIENGGTSPSLSTLNTAGSELVATKLPWPGSPMSKVTVVPGFTVVEVGGLFKVVPEADAKLQTGTVVVGESGRRGDQILPAFVDRRYAELVRDALG